MESKSPYCSPPKTLKANHKPQTYLPKKSQMLTAPASYIIFSPFSWLIFFFSRSSARKCRGSLMAALLHYSSWEVVGMAVSSMKDRPARRRTSLARRDLSKKFFFMFSLPAAQLPTMCRNSSLSKSGGRQRSLREVCHRICNTSGRGKPEEERAFIFATCHYRRFWLPR